MILEAIRALLSKDALYAEDVFFPTDTADRGKVEVSWMLGARHAARALQDINVDNAMAEAADDGFGPITDAAKARMSAAAAKAVAAREEVEARPFEYALFGAEYQSRFGEAPGWLLVKEYEKSYRSEVAHAVAAAKAALA